MTDRETYINAGFPRPPEPPPPHYEPEMWTVPKDAIYAAMPALMSGLDYARSALIEHDGANGRTTRKNQKWAEQMESDIRQIEAALKTLQALP